MIVALTLLFVKPALSLSIEAPQTVRSGEEVVATIWAENRSDKPLVCVIPTLPNASLGIIWKDSLRRGDEFYVRDEQGPFMGQWMHQRVVGVDPFLVLKPGEKTPFYKEKFKVFFTQGFKPSLISEFAKAPRAPLPAGEYTLSFRYGFDRTFKESEVSPSRKSPVFHAFDQKLSKEAAVLYKRTWTGAVDVNATFTVTP